MKRILSYFILALWIPFILFVDYLTPLGIADGMLYLIGVVYAAVLNDKKKIIIYSAVCSLATAAGVFISPDTGVTVLIYGANRVFAILAIWLITAFIIIRMKQKEKIEKLGRMIIMSAWNKQVKYNDTWISVEDYLKKEFNIIVSHSIDPESAEKMLRDLEKTGIEK